MQDEVLDMVVREKRYTIGEEKYILREANGVIGKAFKKKRTAAFQHDGEGKLVRVGESAYELSTFLIIKCLKRISAGGEVEVTQSEVESWPDRIIEKIGMDCMEISELNVTPQKKKEGEEGEGKND